MLDKGLGTTRGEMEQVLRTWGYQATMQAIREWFSRYRHAAGARDATMALYNLYRQDLRQWFYVRVWSE